MMRREEQIARGYTRIAYEEQAATRITVFWSDLCDDTFTIHAESTSYLNLREMILRLFQPMADRLNKIVFVRSGVPGENSIAAETFYTKEIKELRRQCSDEPTFATAWTHSPAFLEHLHPEILVRH
jgi:hypothetical protein